MGQRKNARFSGFEPYAYARSRGHGADFEAHFGRFDAVTGY
jgi:hypothetical protein